MKRARPRERVSHGAGMCARNKPADPLNATRHLRGRPAGEGHQQDTAWVRAVDDEMCDAMGERVGLPRSRASDDKKRGAGTHSFALNAMLHSSPLFAIELVEIRCGHERQKICRRRPTNRNRCTLRWPSSVRGITSKSKTPSHTPPPPMLLASIEQGELLRESETHCTVTHLDRHQTGTRHATWPSHWRQRALPQRSKDRQSSIAPRSARPESPIVARTWSGLMAHGERRRPLFQVWSQGGSEYQPERQRRNGSDLGGGFAHTVEIAHSHV